MSIFGTDGVRGPAGQGVLAPQELLRLGVAFGRAVGPGRVLLARDTRRSGPMMSAALTAGLLATGCDVTDLGELPTPALAWRLAGGDGVGGVMITASHNPWTDNGIKLLSASGGKVDDATQARCEANYEELVVAGGPGDAPEPGAFADGHLDARQAYLGSLTTGRSRGTFEGKTIVLDHAAGAAWQTAGTALRALGAHVVGVADRPDGVNINRGIGAVHPEAAASKVVEVGAWAGLCLDGDADRIALIDEAGTVHDGDAIVGVLATWWQQEGRLRGPVVGTIAGGMGLQVYLQERGLSLERTPVGDRFVAARMKELGCNLGGESSGHVLTPDLCPSGDGTRVGIEVLARAAAGEQPLSAILGAVPKFPAANRKVKVSSKPPLEGLQGLSQARREADAALADSGGRQLLRYSGTEPVLRVLVEARTQELADAWADKLAAAAEAALG